MQSNQSNSSNPSRVPPYVAKLKNVLHTHGIQTANLPYSRAYWHRVGKQYWHWPTSIQRLYVLAMQLCHTDDKRDFKACMRLCSDALDTWVVLYEPKQVGNPTPAMRYCKFYTLGEHREIKTLLADFSV